MNRPGATTCQIVLLAALLVPRILPAAEPTESVSPARPVRQARPRTDRREMMRRLDAIRIPIVHFDETPLPEVMAALAGELRERDPAKTGFNFLFIHQASAPRDLSRPSARTMSTDWSSVVVRIRHPLRHLTALQVLDVISKNAEPPVRFSVVDHSILVLPAAPVSGNVSGAVKRTAPDTFQQGLQGTSARGAPVAGGANP